MVVLKMNHTGMDSTFAGLNVWSFFLGYNTCLNPHRHYLSPRLSVCLSAVDFIEQETLSLSFWLCPSQSVAINHLKWAALTGSWLHHSFIFFYAPPPLLQIAPSSS